MKLPLIATILLAGLCANAASAAEIHFEAYLTAYTYWDNTPPGSGAISHPQVHKRAGGVGTYDDPTTIAAGHSLATGADVLDFPAGTRFYVPDLERYFIVEDTCGDGPQPEYKPCHHNIDEPGYPQLDMWIGGQRGTALKASDCAEDLTRIYQVIQEPARDYPVKRGELHNIKCR